MAGAAWEQFPAAAKYADFRKMLDEQHLDAVVVSTPDHMHASCSVSAMRRGLHCYCEKPIARTVGEARLISQTAAGGSRHHATRHADSRRQQLPPGRGDCAVRGHWPGAGSTRLGRQGLGRNKLADRPPSAALRTRLGPVARTGARTGPIIRRTCRAEWRRWWDFGGGTLSDMGCHFIDLVFWALDLRYPTACRAEGPPPHPQTAPSGVKVVWDFPAGDSAPPMTLTWTDGDVSQREHDGHQFKGSGVYFVGDRGSLFADYGSYKLFPEDKFADFRPPDPWIPDSIGHHAEWIEACKTGGTTTCQFDYSGPLSETVLLGTVAYRVGRPLEWDAIELTATNAPEAATVIHQPYRKGWEL